MKITFHTNTLDIRIEDCVVAVDVHSADDKRRFKFRLLPSEALVVAKAFEEAAKDCRR